MNASFPDQPNRRILAILPTWVGDTVMATPTIRALRLRYPEAHLAALAKPMVAPLLDPCPWLDELLIAEGMSKTAATLRERNFDAAVILPNSFRAALLAVMARIPHRIGYSRGGRGPLLTQRLHPSRDAHGFVPTPTLDYYLRLAEAAGAPSSDVRMELFTDRASDAAASRMIDADRPLVLLNVGANYGDAKMWLPDRFAAVGDRIAQQWSIPVAITGSPKERPIIDAVLHAAKTPFIDLPAAGLDLRTLKAVVKCSSLMITNDTGPRHIAAAFGVPVVTIFGPTHRAWSEIHYPWEQQVAVPVFCGPCQLKRCPLDHRCMTGITTDMVYAQADALLKERLGTRR